MIAKSALWTIVALFLFTGHWQAALLLGGFIKWRTRKPRPVYVSPEATFYSKRRGKL